MVTSFQESSDVSPALRRVLDLLRSPQALQRLAQTAGNDNGAGDVAVCITPHAEPDGHSNRAGAGQRGSGGSN
jgi:hypothetical protein